MLYQCIECSGEVTSRHQAIACDHCGEWQHRRCKTGISSADYRTAVRDGTSLDFVCKFCKELIPEKEVEYDVTQVEDTVDDIYMETTVLDITEADLEELQVDIDLDTSNTESVQMDTSTSDDAPHPHDTTVDIEPPSPPRRLEPPSPPHRLLLTAEIEARGSDDSANEQDDSVADVSSFLVDATIHEADVYDESSIVDADVDHSDDESLVEDIITYEIIGGGSSKGKDLLLDSSGYAYNVKYIRGNTRTWWCSVRNKKLRCPATVIERNDGFHRGIHRHGHAAEVGKKHKVKLTKQVKEEAAANVFKPAKKIVEEEMRKHLVDTDFGIPDPELLARKAKIQNVHKKCRGDYVRVGGGGLCPICHFTQGGLCHRCVFMRGIVLGGDYVRGSGRFCPPW